MTHTSDARRLGQWRRRFARLIETAPPEGGASPELVAAWREGIDVLPDEVLDEELVKLLELIHHKL